MRNFAPEGYFRLSLKAQGRLTEKSSWAFTTRNGDWQKRRRGGGIGVITVNVQMRCVLVCIPDFAKGPIYLTMREEKKYCLETFPKLPEHEDLVIKS